jgi:hypothetical protein
MIEVICRFIRDCLTRLFRRPQLLTEVEITQDDFEMPPPWNDPYFAKLAASDEPPVPAADLSSDAERVTSFHDLRTDPFL